MPIASSITRTPRLHIFFISCLRLFPTHIRLCLQHDSVRVCPALPVHLGTLSLLLLRLHLSHFSSLPISRRTFLWCQKGRASERASASYFLLGIAIARPPAAAPAPGPAPPAGREWKPAEAAGAHLSSEARSGSRLPPSHRGCSSNNSHSQSVEHPRLRRLRSASSAFLHCAQLPVALTVSLIPVVLLTSDDKNRKEDD